MQEIEHGKIMMPQITKVKEANLIPHSHNEEKEESKGSCFQNGVINYDQSLHAHILAE